MKERERVFIPHDIRQRIDEALTYHFSHTGELSVRRLLNRFRIGALDFRDRLYEIEMNYLETGELPFAPELNVDIDAYEQFKQAAEKYAICLDLNVRQPRAIEDNLPITCLDEPIKSPQYRDSALSG